MNRHDPQTPLCTNPIPFDGKPNPSTANSSPRHASAVLDGKGQARQASAFRQF